MRDRILIGYLAAVAALIGYGVDHPAIKAPTAFILPFLALGAAVTITQHQDQIVAFNQYITLELWDYLPSRADHVKNFDASQAAHQHMPRNLWMNLTGQLTLLCGPPICVLFVSNYPYFENGWSLKDSYALVGLVLTLLTGARLWQSRNFRHRVMSAVFAEAKKRQHAHTP
jgi:hypothetical protein